MKFDRNKMLNKERIFKRFLLFPKNINNCTRWLEMATWKSIYTYIDTDNFIGLKSRKYFYYEMEWMEEKILEERINNKMRMESAELL